MRRIALVLSLLALISCDTETPTEPDPPVAASMQIVSGQQQTDTVGRELAEPVVVQVLSAEGAPVRGQVVNFVVTEGGGEVFAGTSITDELGFARERWTLGTTSGPQALQARAVDTQSGQALVFADFSATALPDAPSALVVFSDSLLSGEAGGTASGSSSDTLSVRLADQFGNGIPDLIAEWVVVEGGGQVTAVSGTTTDSLGVFRGVWTLGTDVRAAQVARAEYPDGGLVSSDFTATATLPADLTIMPVSGDQQVDSTAALLAEPLIAKVALADGSGVWGASVVWTGLGSTGSVVAVSETTDSLGLASASWTLGGSAGTDSVEVTVMDTEASLIFTAQVRASALEVDVQTLVLSSLTQQQQVVASVYAPDGSLRKAAAMRTHKVVMSTSVPG